MPRSARVIIPGAAHHITQRGNNRQDVFFTGDDRRTYLAALRERCAAARVRVLGYCLMTNHVHLILVPPDEEALSQVIGRTHFAYTQAINHLHGRSGHLWQGRFYSCPLDDVHVWQALAYIERNPVRARLVRRAWRWPWSSAAAHAGKPADASAWRARGGRRAKNTGRGAEDARREAGVRGTDTRVADSPGLLDLAAWRAAWTPARWARQLQEPEDEGWRRRFWRAASTGRPLAEDRWIARLEARLGRRLRANPVGRPPKTSVSRPRAKPVSPPRGKPAPKASRRAGPQKRGRPQRRIVRPGQPRN